MFFSVLFGLELAIIVTFQFTYSAVAMVKLSSSN